MTPFCACAAATRCTALCATASATSNATKDPPISRLRFMMSLPKPWLLRYEFLHALPVMLLTGIHVALRIDRDAADRKKLSRVPATAAERSGRRQCVALQDMHLLVVTIGDEHVALLRVV